ncbi:MAG TPA: hypothetical protein PLD16_06875 [Fervidobacterium sp.]|nr:hypothetical protein [Fervidobacterium sp.]
MRKYRKKEEIKIRKYVLFSTYTFEKETAAFSRIYGFAKGLKELGHIMIVYSPNMPTENYVVDYSFVDGIYSFPAKRSLWINILRKRFGTISRTVSEKAAINISKQEKSKDSSSKLSACIVNNVLAYNHFYSRTFSENFKIDFSREILRNPIFQSSDDEIVLFTSSGPSLMNYFGYRIKKENPHVFWIADYRDLNQGNPYKSDECNFRGRMMDKLAFKYADLVTTVSNLVMKQNILNANKMGLDIEKKTYVMYNGFLDGTLNTSNCVTFFEKYRRILPSEKIIIAFTGTIYPLRRIDVFFEALKGVENVVFVYAGDSFELVDYFAKDLDVESKVINLKQLSKEEAWFLQENSDILLQLKADSEENGILSGKFFEYLRTNKRILSLGDKDKEYNEICKNLKNVNVLPYDKEKIVKYLKNLRKDDLKEEYDPNIEKFSWKNLVRDFDDFVSQKMRERISNK